MRNVIIPEAGPKRKLLEIAEQLLAEKGFEAVSVRDITQLAGMNVAAVNYHFGSREALLSTAMIRYMQPVTEDQLARLEALERKSPGKVATVESLIDALVRPFMTQAEQTELTESLFYKLIGRIYALQGDGLPVVVEKPIDQVMDRFTRSFQKTLPTIAPEHLAWRLHFLMGGLIHLLTHGARLRPPAESKAMEEALGRFIRFAAAGLREGLVTENEGKDGPQVLFDF